MLKKDIRKIYNEKRTTLSTLQHHEQSQRILQLFKDKTWPPINILMSYSPIPGRNEFNVYACETELIAANPEIINTHPVIATDGLSMDAAVISKDSVFAPNRYNISEPQHSQFIDPLNIDCIFVPLLAFDTNGYRVGYGKGFYDRFLLKCMPGVLKIGFSFFGPVQSIEDINQFDVPLNLCITPTRVYEF